MSSDDGETPNMKAEWAEWAPALSQLDQPLSEWNQQRALGVKEEIRQKKLLKPALEVTHPDGVKYVLTLLFQLLRSDSSTVALFDDLMKFDGNGVVKNPLVAAMKSEKSSVVDKAAWILTTVVSNSPNLFSEPEIRTIFDAMGKCTEVGRMDGIANLVKSKDIRKWAWKIPELQSAIIDVTHCKSPAVVYKFMFAIWMLSFDSDIVSAFKEFKIVEKVKVILQKVRVEKVVRVGLTVLTNLMSHPTMVGPVLDSGLLQVTQQLEFEKWRDETLYDEIREVAQKMNARLADVSNFEKYKDELGAKSLRWGHLHDTRFWQENYKHFEDNNFSAFKNLARLTTTAVDNETLAVACHDLGQFATFHPQGKREIRNYHGLKEKIMNLMSDYNTDREVRREALLCCQKFMLDKWQDVQGHK